MKPVEFIEQTTIFAKDQREYLPLPAHVGRDGTVTTCWELSAEECLQIFESRRLWIQTLTFRQALQPILPLAQMPALSKWK